MMTYYYRRADKLLRLYLRCKEHCYPIFIDKEHTYQDIQLEEKAMTVLSPVAFVAYCYLSMKPQYYIYEVGLEDLPLSEEDAQAAMDELLRKGYLVKYKKSHVPIFDENGELFEGKVCVFYERGLKFENNEQEDSQHG